MRSEQVPDFARNSANGGCTGSLQTSRSCIVVIVTGGGGINMFRSSMVVKGTMQLENNKGYDGGERVSGVSRMLQITHCSTESFRLRMSQRLRFAGLPCWPREGCRGDLSVPFASSSFVSSCTRDIFNTDFLTSVIFDVLLCGALHRCNLRPLLPQCCFRRLSHGQRKHGY